MADTFVLDIAKIRGTFVLGTGEVPGTKSVHLLEWHGSGRRPGRGGIFGWATCLGSHPPTEQQLPADGFRIHVCSETPCIADYHPSKHGCLPPPLVHGRVLAEGIELKELASFLIKSQPRIAPIAALPGAPAPPLPPQADEPVASELHGHPPSLPLPPLPPPADEHKGNALHDCTAVAVAVAVAESEAAVAVTAAAAGAYDSAAAAAATSEAAMAALAAATGACGSTAPASAAAASEAAVAAAGPAGLAGDRGSTAAVAAGPALAEHHQPPAAVVSGTSAMLGRAQRIGSACVDIGLLEFVAFCASRKRRLMMLLPDGPVDIVSAFAAPLIDSTWSMEPFPRLVVPVVSRGNAGWCMASYGEASHFMAAVPAATKPVNGKSAIAEGARKGYHVMPTVADGDCGPDALLHVLCEHRCRERRQEIRQQIRDVLYRNAGSSVWHGIAEACQEINAAPAVAGSSAAHAANVSAAAPGVAGSEAAVNSSPSASAAPAVAGPSVAQSAAGPSVAVTVAAGPSAAEPELRLALLRDGSHVAASSGAALPAALEQAIRWATGLPNPSVAVVRRVAASLSEAGAAELVDEHKKEATPKAAKIHNSSGHCITSRKRASTLLHVRIADAKAFAAWAAANGLDYRATEARSKIRQYLKEMSAVAVMSDAELRRGRAYMLRCLKLHLSDAIVLPTKVATRAPGTRGGGVLYRSRRRLMGNQGRPERASLVKELLFSWFCMIRRSVRGRIPPKLMLAKASMLMVEYIEEHATRGTRADAGVVNYQWMSRWKFQYGVSLRQPNRKFSVPREIMRERLHLFWTNLFRVRRLMARSLGYEPVIENFDQSPFHMNEVGSKSTGSLSIRGVGPVVLKEGHAATRERWTANTMVSSRPNRAGHPPPLQLMFRVKGRGGGERVLSVLRDAIPPWAPWLSVTTSPTGSYCEADILNYLELVLDPMVPGRDWRILMVDDYRAQTTPAVRRAAWHRGYVLIAHGGGVTGVMQVNDTDLHQPLKRQYMDLESSEMLDQQRLRPAAVPVPRKQDCIVWMATVWHNLALHSAVAEGFLKTGQTNAFDRSEDRHICREARVFWDYLHMWRRRDEVIHDIDVEFDARRLAWNYDAVASIILPYPKRGDRYDVVHSDEGSEPADADASDISDSNDSSDSSDSSDGTSDGGDGDDGGLQVVKKPRTGSACGNGTAVALIDSAVADSAVAGSAEALPVALIDSAVAVPTAAEADAVHECQHRLDVLKVVLEQVRSVGQDALAATIANAIRSQERKCRGNKRTSGMVTQAMLANHAASVADVTAAQSIVAKADAEAKRTRLTIKQTKAECDRMEAARVALQRASTVVECLNSVKSFETSDFGQGHPKGGTAEHKKNRMQVLERLRLRFPPLPPEQANDWEWFKPRWDKARQDKFHVSVKGAWAAQFRNEIVRLLEGLRDGDVQALSRWMADQSRDFLCMPALRV